MKGCKVAGCKVFDVRVLSSMSQDVQSAEIRGEASTTFFIFVPSKVFIYIIPFQSLRDFSLRNILNRQGCCVILNAENGEKITLKKD